MLATQRVVMAPYEEETGEIEMLGWSWMEKVVGNEE